MSYVCYLLCWVLSTNRSRKSGPAFQWKLHGTAGKQSGYNEHLNGQTTNTEAQMFIPQGHSSKLWHINFSMESLFSSASL